MATRKSTDTASDIAAETEGRAKQAASAAESAAESVTGEVLEDAEEVREVVSSAADVTIDSVVISQQQAMEKIEASGQAVVEGVSRIQREIADFVSERIRHDMAIQSELLRCRSFDEVRSVQARFLQTAVDQYSAEATKLMRLGQEMVQRTLTREIQ